ncbi:hypothetical protein NXH76_06775 [Blautia schinkii]|nr:hypothetical protein [Blautia schinkii]
MKNRKVFLFLSTLIALLSLYRLNSTVAMANTGQSTQAVTEPQPEYVSTGAELMQWLELHKRTGGIVKLTDNIVLNGYNFFGHDRINLPSIFVETGRYTITVTGEAEFLSDKHLIFQGQGNTNGILRVSKGGLLSLTGITVQSGQGQSVPQYALQQEEGAGLVVGNCEISGNIRYADTPYVMYDNSVSVIVEKGQKAVDLLPPEIKCNVNYQGGIRYNELIPVTWNLTGTEKYQEQRRRFYVQGSFSDVAFMELPVCTVIYNDYPLTFTNIKTQASASGHLFRIWYTKPEEYLPIEVSAEYSFNGKTWTLYDKFTAESPSDYVFMGFTSEQWDVIENPYIFLRLQWDNDGTLYYSNVLRFAAEDLKKGEDQGGTRGGGTAIINPADTPQIGGSVFPQNPKPSGTKPDSNSNINEPHSGESDTEQSGEKNSASSGENNNDTAGESVNGTTGENVNDTKGDIVSETPEDTAGKTSEDDTTVASEELDSEASVETAVSAEGENDASPEEQTPAAEQDAVHKRNTVIGLVFLGLCAAAGGVGFCFRAGIFGRLFRRKKGKSYK